jgi:hypothetical protein
MVLVLALVLAVCLQLGYTTPGVLETRRADGPVLAAQVVPPATDQTSPSSAQTQPASPTNKPPASPPSTHKKKHKAAAKPPQNVVVKNGSTSDPAIQFSTPISPEQASREKQDTAGLLAKADANLQGLSGHQLNASQQDTSAQVRSYIQQAKTAEESGDLQGAHNLAVKAVLLSNELAQK